MGGHNRTRDTDETQKQKKHRVKEHNVFELFLTLLRIAPADSVMSKEQTAPQPGKHTVGHSQIVPEL